MRPLRHRSRNFDSAIAWKWVALKTFESSTTRSVGLVKVLLPHRLGLISPTPTAPDPPREFVYHARAGLGAIPSEPPQIEHWSSEEWLSVSPQLPLSRMTRFVSFRGTRIS